MAGREVWLIIYLQYIIDTDYTNLLPVPVNALTAVFFLLYLSPILDWYVGTTEVVSAIPLLLLEEVDDDESRR